MRQRAELWTHGQQTNSQYHLPASGNKLADNTKRPGGAERVPAPAVQKRSAVHLPRVGHDDHLLRAVELSVLKTATQHDANTLYRLRTVPGIGEILSVVLRDEIHDLQRFPRVQACVSYCRLVTCAKESAGTYDGTSGAKLGNAYLTGAFSEATVLVLRTNPAGQKALACLEKKQAKGQALTGLAHQLARAV